MKKTMFLVLIGLSLLSCEKDELKANLRGAEDLEFSGTFETINSEDLTGTVNSSLQVFIMSAQPIYLMDGAQGN